MALRSMTGFGVGSAPLGAGAVLVEIRALNHRYQDVRIKTPGALSDHAFFVEQLVRQRLGRGRYDVGVRFEGDVLAGPRLSEGRLKALFAELSRLRDELAPETPLDLSAILSVPDVVELAPPPLSETRAALEAALAQAVDALSEMRATEGCSLERDLRTRLTSLRSLRDQLEASSADLVEHQQGRLRERIEHLLGDTNVALSQERLEHEIALVADKSDITEELVRLGSHFDQFEGLLGDGDPVGRRLDFLLQEIGREVNTIGSKSQHAPLAHLVVETKAQVERLREQVQNVD